MHSFLAMLPILLLVAVSLTRGVKSAVWVGWAATTALFFYWGADGGHYLGALAVALLATANILLTVLGAVFLYTVMQRAGLITELTHSLEALHPAREVRFFLLALGLTAFFEGVAGFGTPGAIVPLMLMALGYEAVLAVSVVLLFDGLFAVFGAVGTPLTAGLQGPLGLAAADVKTIGLLAAGLLTLAGLLVLWFVFRLVSRAQGLLAHRWQVLVLYGLLMLPFCALAALAPELATVFGALLMLGLAVPYLRSPGTPRLDLRPWLPYAALALLLLLPKLLPPLRSWLSWELAFADMFGSGIGGSIRPLQSPFLPFVVVGLGVAYFRKSISLPLREPLGKMGSVLVVLFPSVAIAQLMVYSGEGGQPSMVAYLATLLSRLGPAYPVAAPFIGVMGTFITGSTTISNVVFGASQQQAATALGLPLTGVLALQMAGASLGNAICLFNIIAAASVAGIKDYRAVLANNLLPTLLAALLVGGLGLAWLLVEG
ncbi:L-lactate transport [Hymenobacter lapidarius]|uniref:L-lactate permease n=1 Tax=Hymenobacter lapidarius TaxID=1908237 RepID=A0A1G1T3F7_9BACT|nr:L-lactate permease [Hymenobacter lapidarius]OGX85408.1 L-lactate transport [Hymenobacter lapidarius]